MEHRNLHADAVDSVSGTELQAVIEGSAPSMLLLRQLAPALGLHVQDLLVLADTSVPEDLAPLDPAAGSSARMMAFDAAELPTERARQLRQLIQALPQEERTKPAWPLRQHDPGPGAFLLGMLNNRNLARYYTAQAAYIGTRGDVYLSETEVQHALARSNKRLTPDMFAGFANVLGIPAADLAALTGFDLPPRVFPEQTAIVAELLWDVRRLTSEQARHVATVARAMLEEG
jgi:hypothetical protein